METTVPYFHHTVVNYCHVAPVPPCKTSLDCTTCLADFLIASFHISALTLACAVCALLCACGSEETHSTFLCSTLLFSLSTEQRKKYSNSNFIMQETSQYHVEVRATL